MENLWSMLIDFLDFEILYLIFALPKAIINLIPPYKCRKTMKIPFHRFFGPLIKECEICNFICDVDLCGNITYIICFALFGLVVTSCDILRKISNDRLYFSIPMFNKNGVHEDFKFGVAVIDWANYFGVLCGAITENPVLYMPWLILTALAIIGNTLFIILSFVLRKDLVSFKDIRLYFFTIHNWLQIFTAFKRNLTPCDY